MEQNFFQRSEKKEKQDPYPHIRKVLYQVIQVHAFVMVIVILHVTCPCTNGQNQMPEESG